MVSSWQRKEAKIHRTNNYGRGLRRWHSTSVNTPAQAESLLHTLERAAAGIGLYFNTDKMEYMCFDQRGDITSLNNGPLKLVDKFTKQWLINREKRQDATGKRMDS